MNGAAAGAAAAAAIAQAIKVSGAIVRVEPGVFESLLRRQPQPLVVRAVGGLFSTQYQYLTSYRGLIFFTKSPAQIGLPGGSEIIQAGKIWIPQ